MDLHFPTSVEIVALLCSRLRQERLLREWTQAELAGRAGITVSTLSNLEAGKNINLETMVKVAMVLGRTAELTELFKPEINSIEDVKRLEKVKNRHRIKERRHG